GQAPQRADARVLARRPRKCSRRSRRGSSSAPDCDQPPTVNEIEARAEPFLTTRVYFPASPEGTSKREIRPSWGFSGRRSATDWLRPSLRGRTVLPSGSVSETLSSVNARPPLNVPWYPAS